jgi:hypothetical protein
VTGAERDQLFEAFVQARRRPAVFFFVDRHQRPVNYNSVLRLHDQLRDREFEELDLVIHSGGGSVHAAYQAMTLLRLHAKAINACVPFFAKSAATLLCIGADKMVLGEHAELGPLDVQIWEEKQPGKGEFHSALDPFKALEQMQSFSVEALSSAMQFIVNDYQMSYDDSLRHAVEFVSVTTGPLVGRLDPEKIGQYSRELSVATEYGRRLLRRYSKWPPAKINAVVDQLVYGYPSHEFVIDLTEVKELGFDVESFAPESLQAVRELRQIAEEDQSDRDRNIIKLVDFAAIEQSETITVEAIAGEPSGESGGVSMADETRQEIADGRA